MYVDKRKRRWPKVVSALVAAVVIICLWRLAVPAAGGDISEEGARALRTAVERCALQCYAVEGAYPPSLAYLEENYGLQINRKEFYVVYDIFAPNVPPAVKVVSRH